MKKYSLFTLACIASFVAFVACQKDSPSRGADPANGVTTETPAKEQVTITASIPNDGLTKVTLTQDGSDKKLIKLAWEDDDVIVINGNNFDIVDATISADGKTADFTGTAPSPDGSGKYNISYTKAFPRLGDDFNNQTQAADGSLAHLAFGVALKGASDYTSFSFVDGDQGGSLEESSVLHLKAQLPAGASWLDDVKKVIFKSSANVFNGSNKLTVTLTTPGTGGDRLLDVYASIPAGCAVSVPDLTVQFQVSANDYDIYTAYREFSPSKTFPDGNAHYLGIDCSNIESYAGTDDDGSSDHPFLIGDQHQMMAVKDLMVADATRYFKLVDDIDLDGETWTRLNPSPFTKAINLNGNNKTISNLGDAMFQDFNGTASNLTLDQSTVSSSGEVLGIFACKVATAASTITNVDITNSSLNATSSYCGGLIGQSDIPIILSDIDVVDTGITGGLAGGIIGYPTKAASISYCNYDGGTITSNYQYTGGIAGATGSGQTIEISDCSVINATITSAYNRCGGVIGAMRNGTTIERTTVGEAGTNVTITMTGSEACYTGGFIGLMEGGTISDNCKAYVDLAGVKTSIGGFIGRMTAGSVSGCKSYGNVSGPGTIGGFIGDVTGSSGITILNNESNCNVTATSTFVGGFVGYLKGSTSVSGCSYKTGKVWSNLGGGTECYIGGFAGYIGTKSEAFTGTISGCLVSDAIVDAVKYKDDGKTAASSGQFVGGFAGGIGHSTYGNNTGSIQLCRVHNTPILGGHYCGGFAGVSYATIEKCGVSGNKTVQCYGNSNGGLLGYQNGHHVQYCYSNNTVRHANKSNVGGLIGNANNTTVEECYSAGDLTNSSGSSTNSTTWGGMLGAVNTVTSNKLIRWNHSNNNSIVGNEASVPANCYVKTAGDSSFQTTATSLSWSTNGTIWNYSEETPALVGMP